jgi:cytosine/adenosine deaminase-related metal-dependent hydrolase
MISRFLNLLSVVTVAAACGPRVATPTLSITHVAVVDAERGTVLFDRTVLVHGTRIERVDSNPLVPTPPSARTIDGTGQFLIPGLWDMHVHGDEARTAGQLLS